MGVNRKREKRSDRRTDRTRSKRKVPLRALSPGNRKAARRNKPEVQK